MRTRTNAKDSAITITQARMHLKMLLSGAVSLDHLTVESLIRSYRVPPKEIEYMLTIERQKRVARN